MFLPGVIMSIEIFIRSFTGEISVMRIHLMKGPRLSREDDVFNFEFMKTIQFSGHECCVLENGSLRLLVTRSIGPRILSLGFLDGENIIGRLA